MVTLESMKCVVHELVMLLLKCDEMLDDTITHGVISSSPQSV